MIEQNPDHPNGTCEACGGPCAVFGCRYCPACYDRVTLAGRPRAEPRDLSRAWPVIDGPRQGERVSSKRDYFDALIGPPSTDPAQPDRVRYYLRALDDGRFAWSVTPPSA